MGGLGMRGTVQRKRQEQKTQLQVDQPVGDGRTYRIRSTGCQYFSAENVQIRNLEIT